VPRRRRPWLRQPSRAWADEPRGLSRCHTPTNTPTVRRCDTRDVETDTAEPRCILRNLDRQHRHPALLHSKPTTRKTASGNNRLGAAASRIQAGGNNNSRRTVKHAHRGRRATRETAGSSSRTPRWPRATNSPSIGGHIWSVWGKGEYRLCALTVACGTCPAPHGWNCPACPWFSLQDPACRRISLARIFSVLLSIPRTSTADMRHVQQASEHEHAHASSMSLQARCTASAPLPQMDQMWPQCGSRPHADS